MMLPHWYFAIDAWFTRAILLLIAIASGLLGLILDGGGIHWPTIALAAVLLFCVVASIRRPRRWFFCAGTLCAGATIALILPQLREGGWPLLIIPAFPLIIFWWAAWMAPDPRGIFQ